MSKYLLGGGRGGGGGGGFISEGFHNVWWGSGAGWGSTLQLNCHQSNIIMIWAPEKQTYPASLVKVQCRSVFFEAI